MIDSPELHGMSPKSTLRSMCKHEAGHTLMFWLFDYHVYGVVAKKEGGLCVTENFRPDTPVSLVLLQLLAGIQYGCQPEVAYDLEDHIGTLEYFHPKSDCYKISKILNALHGNPLGILLFHQDILGIFRRKFSKQFRELVDLLLHSEANAIAFDGIYEMFGRWDCETGFDKRPKSDYVMRLMMRQRAEKPPRNCFIGWDGAPLATWEYKRQDLRDFALEAKECMKDVAAVSTS